MVKIIFILLFLALAAYGQQTSVAVLPSDGTVISNDELEVLTDKMREAALKVLPTKDFVLVKQDVVVKRLGGAEKYVKKCSESSCIVDLGEMAMVQYVAQASVGKLGNKIRLKVELYNVSTKGQIGILNEMTENVEKLFDIVEKRVPEMFSRIPGAYKSSKASYISVPDGISVQKPNEFEMNGGQSYVVNFTTEPTGAVLIFDDMPGCLRTPCSAQLEEGNVHIKALYEQYEVADTTVFIKQNGQSIKIKLKANFGVLEIKPAYLNGIGKTDEWNLSINDKNYPLGEIRLAPNKYKGTLSHNCYENTDFEIGINRDKRIVFDMSSKIALKKGGLDLSAERDYEPVIEPVFVNGKYVGETPFKGSVPICAKVEIGKSKETVDVNLKHYETVSYKHRFNTYKPIVTQSYTNSYESNSPSYKPFGDIEPLEDFDDGFTGNEKTYTYTQTKPYKPPMPDQSPSDTLFLHPYFSIYTSNITSFYEYENQELYRAGVDFIIGVVGLTKKEELSKGSSGLSLFFGFGASGEDIGEFILGLDLRNQLWLLPERISIPISLGFAWRMQWMDMENKLVAEFIDNSDFRHEPESYLSDTRSLRKHNFDIMPSIDLQIFLGESFAIYVGYMYRITYSGNWGFDYDGDYYEVPERYNPLQNLKEQIWGIPGVLRFGIRL